MSSPFPTTVEVSKLSSKPTCTLSQHQKYSKALVITSELASIASEASGTHRMKLIKDLIVLEK